MGWFGTLIGSSLGFVFGGPLGAIGGAALGHILIDRPSRSYANRQRFNPHEQRQAGYFIALFSIMGKIAAADGIVSSNERALVEQFITHSQMNATQRVFALKIFDESKNSNHSIVELTNQFYLLTANNTQFHLNFMDILIRLAAADGTIDSQEQALLQQVAKRLYISNADFATLLRRRSDGYTSSARSTTKSHYDILGCTPNSSDDEIRSAYRKLASAYHPDKIIGKELPDEFTTFAKEKFQEIQGAYAAIKQARGMH